MPKQVNVTGLTNIRIQLAIGAGQLVDLGESQDMVDIDERVFLHNVPGDAHGGPQGPPIDVQMLGMTVGVTCELSRWDPNQVDALRQRRVLGSLGSILATDVGDLLLSTGSFRVLLDTPTRALNFPTCILREPIRFSMGTKYTAVFFSFEAHRTQSGQRQNVLYNSDVAEYTT